MVKLKQDLSTMNIRLLSLCAFLITSNLNGQEVESFSLDSSIKMDGIYRDGDTLYIAEGWDGERIFKVLPDGEVITFAEGLSGPVALVKRENGNLYVSEWNASRLSVVNYLGEVAVYASIAAGPGPMTMDESETIYVTHNVNDGSGIISTIDVDGTVSVLAEGAPLINPGGIDFGTDGNLYVANFNNANIVQIKPDTTMSVIATIPAAGFWKTGHLTAGQDQLFVTAISSHKIYTVDFDGTVSEYAGTGELGHVDGPLETCQFSNPNGIVLDHETGTLYITKAFGPANYVQFIDIGFAGVPTFESSDFPISIYPNPSNGIAMLDLSKIDDANVVVYNLAGELIQNYGLVTTPTLELNLRGHSGIFLVKIMNSENAYSTRIVVE